jgi:hypothetical protein
MQGTRCKVQGARYKVQGARKKEKTISENEVDFALNPEPCTFYPSAYTMDLELRSYPVKYR